MEPSQAKHEIDRNTPTYMCYGSLLISVSVFIIFLNPSFPLRTHSCTAHIKGRNPMCVLLFPLLQCVEEKNTFSSGKAQIPFAPREDCLTAPCWMSGFLRGRERKREREGSFEIDCTVCYLVCYLVVISSSSSSTCCLISAVTLTVILTAPAPSPCSVNSCKCQLL